MQKPVQMTNRGPLCQAVLLQLHFNFMQSSLRMYYNVLCPHRGKCPLLFLDECFIKALFFFFLEQLVVAVLQINCGFNGEQG